MRTNPKHTHTQVYHTTMTASYRAEHGLGPEVVLNQALGDECLVFKVRKSSSLLCTYNGHGRGRSN